MFTISDPVVSFHCYDNDIQFYISSQPDETAKLLSFSPSFSKQSVLIIAKTEG